MTVPSTGRPLRDTPDRLAVLSAAVEQTPDTILILDTAARIEYVNPAFESTTGYTAAEAIGQSSHLVDSGAPGEGLPPDVWTRLLAGEPYSGTHANRKKNGDRYWANHTITPVTGPDGAITHFVAVLKDVTEVRKYHEQEVQLRLARAVQERFNPAPPVLPGLEIAAVSHPADATGGDYFDFIALPDNVVFIAIGDVSGHGFDAALIMALTHAYMRAFAAMGLDVGETLRRANLAFVGDLEPGRYVTMLLIRVDVTAHRMTYASAGHIAGVLLTGEGRTDYSLDSTGVPLGLFADSTFPTRQLRYSGETVLVLSTDGATETTDGDGVEFGQRGVVDYVRAHLRESADEIAAGLYRAARAFAGTAQQFDDITSVIVKVAA